MNAFDIVQHLGEGEFGSVDLVRRRTDGRIFIMKINMLRRTESAFAREVRLMQRLFQFNHAHCHPYVSCYAGSGFDIVNQTSFLLLALNGIAYNSQNIYSMMAFLDSEPRLKEAQCMRLTYELLEGLLFIHDADMAHGDLHANNIIVQKTGNDYSLYIIDLGLGCDDDAKCKGIHGVDLKKLQDIDWFFVGYTLARLWQSQLAFFRPSSAMADFFLRLQNYNTPVHHMEIASFAYDIAIWLRQNGVRSSLRQTQRRLTVR